MTYLNAALDLIIIALFGWLLLEIVNWIAHWLHERECRRQRQAEFEARQALLDERIAAYADADRDFARLQKQIRGEK